MMTLLEELRTTLQIDLVLPKVYCNIYEDNNYCIELVECPKMTPKTKHVR